MAVGFDLLVENLQNINFFNTFLPWVLIFTIAYGILTKTEILGDNKSVIAVASIAISFIFLGGLFLVVPHNFFPIFFAILGVIISVLFAVLIVAGFLGASIQDFFKDVKGAKWIIFIFLIIFFLGIALSIFGQLEPAIKTASDIFSNENFLNFLLTLILIGIFVLVARFAIKG